METIILFAPLVGALICGFGWRIIGEAAAQWTATGLLFLSCLLSWIVFLTFDGQTEIIPVLRWIESGSLATDWGIRLDRLTAIMLIVITLRCMKGHFTADRHFAFEAVAWYWHFVDVVWLGLFVFVYVY